MTSIIEKLIEPKLLKLIKFFISRPREKFYLHEIAKNTGIAVATCHRLLNKLANLKIIEKTEMKKLVLYELAQNKEVEELTKLFDPSSLALRKFVEEVKALEGIEDIILHGEITGSKANLIILGKLEDPSLLKDVAAKIKQDFGLNLIYLTLTYAQYAQMLDMGLFKGKRTSLLKT